MLVSRYHTSPDLILPIDAQEKEMLDAVDGRRSIAAIVDGAGGDRMLRARSFFRKAVLVRPGGLRFVQRLLTRRPKLTAGPRVATTDPEVRHVATTRHPPPFSISKRKCSELSWTVSTTAG